MKKITFLILALAFSGAGFAQFSENFDAGTTLPAGWSVINGGDPDQTWAVTDMSDYGVDAHSGTNAATIFYDPEVNHDDYLITPAITVVAGVNNYFTFWARSLDVDYPETIDVKLSTTGAAATDFTVTLQANVAPESGDNYYKYAFDLSAYVGQTVYIAFYSSTVNQDIFEVDDVVSTALPTCFEPSLLTAANISDVSATISWTSTGTAFQVEYGFEDFVLGTGTMVNTTNPTVNLTGLTADSNYDVYVRNDCGSGNFSTWELVSFETLETPAANDDCTTATAVAPGGDFEGGSVMATSVGATNGDEVPSCQDFVVNDVWFSVVVPADGNISLETGEETGSDNTDTIMAAYSGTCGSLTEIGCNDDISSATGNYFSKLDLTGLTPGATIYVGVWQYDSFFGTTPGAFRFSAYNATLLGTPTVNKQALSFYPNPVKDFLNLSYDQNITDVAVSNMLGQQVLSQKINAADAQLDLSALVPGTYAVKVNTADATKIIKIVKQ